MDKHIPVMLTDIIDALSPQSGQKYIDCTLGGGGYTLALATAVGSSGLVLATDLDEEAIANIEMIKAERGLTQISAVHSNFKNIASVVAEHFPGTLFDGIVMDLGLSSAQLADLGRGFSFRIDSNLNMGFDASEKKNKTENIINNYREKELTELIRNYGEEKYAHRIAQSIIARRSEAKITTTSSLVDAIAAAVPALYRNDKRLHFATRTFQALRIATNDELNNLREVLPSALSLLKSGGILAAVSFHSLEDRIVKQFLVEASKDCLCPPRLPVCICHHQAQLKIITKKPLTASAAELATNPRSRSAKLRLAQKIWIKSGLATSISKLLINT